MSRTFRNVKEDSRSDYAPSNEVSSIYQRRGIKEANIDGYFRGHKSTHDKKLSKKLRGKLKKETENLIDEEIG